MKPIAPVKKTRFPFSFVLFIHSGLSQCTKGWAFNCYTAKAFFKSSTPSKVSAQLPYPKAVLPQDIGLNVVLDRTTTIRASIHDVEVTLIRSIFLVVAVVFVFRRSTQATLIPAVAVPISLVSTFAVMCLFGFSIDNLSLMALTIASGFVVDDDIVVMENIARHRENGMQPFAADLQGAHEIGFTVFSISISLVPVFIPILLMGGVVARLFRKFAITLSAAISSR